MGRDPGHGGGGEGGVTQPNCLEASQIGTPGQKKLTLGHLDKNEQKLPKNDPFGGSLFSRNRLFSEKKRINGNTGGTGLKKRSENLSFL